MAFSRHVCWDVRVLPVDGRGAGRAETHFATVVSFYTNQHGGRRFPFATEKFFKGRNCFCSDLYILFSVKMRVEKQASDPVCNNLIKTAKLKKKPCGVFL